MDNISSIQKRLLELGSGKTTVGNKEKEYGPPLPPESNAPPAPVGGHFPRNAPAPVPPIANPLINIHPTATANGGSDTFPKKRKISSESGSDTNSPAKNRKKAPSPSKTSSRRRRSRSYERRRRSRSPRDKRSSRSRSDRSPPRGHRQGSHSSERRRRSRDSPDTEHRRRRAKRSSDEKPRRRSSDERSRSSDKKNRSRNTDDDDWYSESYSKSYSKRASKKEQPAGDKPKAVNPSESQPPVSSPSPRRLTPLERLAENSKALLDKRSPLRIGVPNAFPSSPAKSPGAVGGEREPIRITIGGVSRVKRVEIEAESFGPPLPPNNKIGLDPPIMESTPARQRKPPKKPVLDMFDDGQNDPFDSFGVKMQRRKDVMGNAGESGPPDIKGRKLSTNPLTGRVNYPVAPRRSRFSDTPANAEQPSPQVEKLKKLKNPPSPVPKPIPKPSTPRREEIASLSLLCSPHPKKGGGSQYSSSMSMGSSSSSSSSDSDSDSSTSQEERDRKGNGAPPLSKNTSMEMQLQDDSGDDNYDPDNCIHPDTDDEEEVPLKPILKHDSKVELKVDAKIEISKVESKVESKADSKNNDSNTSSATSKTNTSKLSNSGNGKFVPVNTSGNSLGPEPAQLDVTNDDITSSGSSMVMSPVTPPTEDEEEKTLHIDEGLPVSGPPPPAPPIVNVSPKQQQINPQQQPTTTVVAENVIKPQAVVNPMASDTSPVSSGSNQNGVVVNVTPDNKTNDTTVVQPTAIPATARLQSVLTSQLSTGRQQQPPPPPPPPGQPISNLPGNQANPSAPATADPFTQQTLISIEGIAKALAPQRPTENSIQAEMVLRNLAELGKQISMNSILNKVTGQVAPVVENVKAPSKNDFRSASPSTSPSSPDTPPTKRDKKSKNKKSKSDSHHRSDKKTFKKRKDFQKAVVATAKESIKPHYKARRIDKLGYKKIMRDLVRKVVNTSRTYTLDKDKINRLIEKYVTRYTSGSSGSKKKAEMLNYFNEQDQGAKSDQSNSPDGLQHLFAPGAPAMTIPQLPLPPPPPKQPPPRQFGQKTHKQMF